MQLEKVTSVIEHLELEVVQLKQGNKKLSPLISPTIVLMGLQILISLLNFLLSEEIINNRFKILIKPWNLKKAWKLIKFIVEQIQKFKYATL